MLTQLLLLILIISILIGNPELYPNQLKIVLKKFTLLLIFLTLMTQHPEIAQRKNWPALKEMWRELTN
jgi:hypothetical protein